MQHRIPPKEPEDLPRSPTRAQIKRHEALMLSYRVGEALREYALYRKILHTRMVPDALSLLPSPALEASGGRRLADNGTPRSMDDVCAWIDREARVISPVRHAYAKLQADLPVHARIAWRRHVQLWTAQEVADVEGLSTRTVVRYLGVANLFLMAALRLGDETATGRKHARQLLREADTREAAAWQDRDVELTEAEKALAGIEK